MYRTILVPLDGSAFGEHALPLALSIARQSAASIQLVHVHTPQANRIDVAPVTQPHGLSRDRAIRYLTELAECLSPKWEVSISIVVLDGLAVDELHTHAIAAGADLVVMTTHGYGPLSRMWMGSVADTLVRRLPMPIILTRPHQEALDLLEQVRDRPFGHILIPLDGSPLAEQALEPALAVGALMSARYTLLQALNPPVIGYAPAAYAARLDEQMLEQWQAEAQVYLEQIAAGLRARGHQASTQVSVAPPAIAILDYAHDHSVDLIALATHGRGGLTRLLLGSVADKVVRGAGTPVLLQRPQAVNARRASASADVAQEFT
jgi:nucleotide-binding universal stress UspA family protein